MIIGNSFANSLDYTRITARAYYACTSQWTNRIPSFGAVVLVAYYPHYIHGQNRWVEI